MKVGLVLEGGAMRGMYTAGVLDVFMDNDIKIDGILGVSAGALFGVNYFSKQKGRALRYSKRFCKSRRYMSFLSYIFTGNIINKNFAFYKVSKELDVFDDEIYKKNNTGFYAVATNVETGKAEYLEIDSCFDKMESLRATSAMPLVSRMVEIDGKKYLDGGISDSIPVDKCMELGYDKIIVVLTRDIDYRKKELSNKVVKSLNKRFKKYANLVKTMINRPKEYNDTISKILKLEKEEKIFVIRPSSPINIKVLERNSDNLQKVYDLGVNDCNNSLSSLKNYLKNN